MTTKKQNVATIATQPGAMATLAARLGVEPSDVFVSSLRRVAFKSPEVTTEQLMALVLVSNQYRLNPFIRELYAFPEKGGGIVPIVSVDGWLRIINEHPMFDGMEYAEVVDADGKLVAGEVTIHRKDRSHPLVLREYLKEVQRNTDPWKLAEHRMLRHKTLIQGARVAFGFAGIYDPDEAERVIQTQRVTRLEPGLSGAAAVAKLLEVELPAGDWNPDEQGPPAGTPPT